jgi:uncharacterized protein YkwD/LysM repeat protein
MDKRSKVIAVVIAGLLMLVGINARAMPEQAEATRTPKSGNTASYSPYDVIAAVNAVRAANGLPAFEVNGALMAAAQAHSNYQASIGSTTHTGQGGSDVKSRALAAGYGGGADVSVTENIFGGGKASPQQAVSWWQGDSLHLNTLLSTRHTEAGAGVAEANGSIYYTLDVGAVNGGSVAPAATSAVSAAAPAAAGSAQPTAVAYGSFKIAKPGPDGSIVHVVQSGQTLWTIAAMYEVTVDNLLQLNGLNSSSFIVTGQKIIIRAPGANETEAFSTAAVQATKTAPNPTPMPRRTATRAATAQAMLLPTQASAPAASGGGAVGANLLLVLIAVLVVGGAGMMVAGFVLKRVE